jgi:hypothetical protein
VPRNQEEYRQNLAREGNDEYHLLNAEPTLPELLAATFHELSTKSSCNVAISATTTILATLSVVLPSVAGNSVNPATAANSRNIATTTDSSSRPKSSSRPQNSKVLPSFRTIMPITGGSAMEFETKKQRNNYFRSVNTIINDGPAARLEWAKVPITFTEEDFKLKFVNHNDAMVIEVNIAGWVIEKILVDNGSSADILFLKTFEKMNLSKHMLYLPEYPLQCFGGKPIKPVGKVSLPVSFGDLDNARTETLTFYVVDIYHPYLAIFSKGFMNKFDAVMRL